jgi:hypothetical protein
MLRCTQRSAAIWSSSARFAEPPSSARCVSHPRGPETVLQGDHDHAAAGGEARGLVECWCPVAGLPRRPHDVAAAVDEHHHRPRGGGVVGGAPDVEGEAVLLAHDGRHGVEGCALRLRHLRARGRPLRGVPRRRSQQAVTGAGGRQRSAPTGGSAKGHAEPPSGLSLGRAAEQAALDAHHQRVGGGGDGARDGVRAGVGQRRVGDRRRGRRGARREQRERGEDEAHDPRSMQREDHANHARSRVARLSRRVHGCRLGAAARGVGWPEHCAR